jgi:hypothetical protein
VGSNLNLNGTKEREEGNLSRLTTFPGRVRNELGEKEKALIQIQSKISSKIFF